MFEELQLITGSDTVGCNALLKDAATAIEKREGRKVMSIKRKVVAYPTSKGMCMKGLGSSAIACDPQLWWCCSCYYHCC